MAHYPEGFSHRQKSYVSLKSQRSSTSRASVSEHELSSMGVLLMLWAAKSPAQTGPVMILFLPVFCLIEGVVGFN